MTRISIASRTLSLLLAMLLCVMLVPLGVFAEKGTLAGSGTEDDPYLIADADDLIAFAALVNAEASSTAFAKLTADIDLANQTWAPIMPASGYVTEAYAGTFDGDYHTIDGLAVSASGTYAGLFGVINGATVKNLTVRGSVTADATNTGGVIGKVQQGTVENVAFDGTVSSTKNRANVGGVIGYAGNSATQTASLSGLANTATVYGDANGTVGGVVGYAKFSTLTDCYNKGAVSGASRAGGIAGQLQNNVTLTNAYSVGALSGSSTAADIVDFLYSSAKLVNCHFTTRLSGAGTGTAEDCAVIGDGLLDALGDAFAAGDEYPILAWQKGGAPVVKEPKLSVGGKDTLVMTNSGAQPSVTLTATYENVDEKSPVVWSVDNDAVVSLTSPENPADDNHTVIVTALAPGKATVTAVTEDEKLSASLAVSVLPFITTVGFESDPVAGEAVNAAVFTLGGVPYDFDNWPALTFRWKVLDAEDYAAGNTGSANYKDIAGAFDRTLTVPSDFVGDYLSFELLVGAEPKTPSSPKRILDTVEKRAAEDAASLSVDTSDVKAAKTLALAKTLPNGSTVVWGSDNDLIDPATGDVTLPESGIVTVTLSAAVTLETVTKNRTFTVKIYSEEAAEAEKADKLAALTKKIASLGDFYKLYPVFGVDENVLDMVKAALGETDYTLTLKTVDKTYGGAAIDEDGTITYYYADPNEESPVHFASFTATFTLADGDAAVDFDVPVIVYWDADKVKAVMTDEILAGVTLPEEADDDFDLPKVVDGKKWTLISWTSADESVVSVSDKGRQTADTLFDPYTAVVHKGKTARHTTLTAAFTFMFANDGEEPVVLYKTFDVTVAPLSEAEAAAVEDRLAASLEKGFAKAGLRDAVTGKALAEKDGVYTAENDILFPTTRDFGIDGKVTPVTITSDSAAVAEPDVANAARAVVYRPAVGKDDATANVTVTVTDKDTGLSAAKTFTLAIPALTAEEIEAEKALMDKVAAAYFDGIRAGNTAPDDIASDLAPFVEAYEKNGRLVFVRDVKDVTGDGIAPVPLENWEELEAFRLFRSSNPASVNHETLKVKLQKNGKAVTVDSALSSEKYGKYGELYAADPNTYADYADLADLWYRPVSVDLTVRGRSTPRNAKPLAVEETVDVTFKLAKGDEVLIDTSYTGLAESTTVFDVFKTALDENGFTYGRRGSYVYEITTPDGVTYEELDEGSNSGWMYRVNDKLPGVYMGAYGYMGGYGLADGDEISVFYTTDYKKEQNRGSKATAISYVLQNDTTDKTDTEDKKPVIAYSDIEGLDEASDILAVTEAGLMIGEGNDRFVPKGTLTRAMFVTILHRFDGEPDVTVGDSFTDVEKGSWYEKAVFWAKENGIVNGVSETAFAPDEPVTREQAAAVLTRYFREKVGIEEREYAVPFDDADAIEPYAVLPVGYLAANGYIREGTTRFRPADPATRAEIAVLFARALEKTAK